MPEEINNPEVSTLEETDEVAEAPEDIDGQAEVTEPAETEQAESGTDKTEQPKNYKELQAEFTRKSQEYADFKKQFEKQQEELNAFRQYYSQQQIQQKQQPEEKSAKDFAEMTEMEKFNYLVDQRITDSVKPYIDKISALENYISSMQQESANRVWNEFVQQHPDAVNYSDQLAQLITQHNMPLDRAYKLLKADIAPVEAKQEVLKEIQVKKDAAKLQMPVTKTPATSNEIPDSFEDAYNKAMQKISGK